LATLYKNNSLNLLHFAGTAVTFLKRASAKEKQNN
jgi:hypothetical protein